MIQPKDQIYLDKVLQGDASSYSYLVEKYKDMAYTVALKIVRNAEDAEEVAQDSFIKAFQQLKTFQGKCSAIKNLISIISDVLKISQTSSRNTESDPPHFAAANNCDRF